MWLHRFVMSGAAAVVALVATSLARTSPQSASILMSGQVRITTAPDGRCALVSIDAEEPHGIDAVVDRAFLVQTAEPMNVAFAGPATLVFTTTRLTVAPASSTGWAFSVTGRDTDPAPASRGVTMIAVVGLSHYWGKDVEVSHEELVSGLLLRVCRAGALAPPGPGRGAFNAGDRGDVDGDALRPDGTSSAGCAESYHSHCSSSNGCPSSNQRSAMIWPLRVQLSAVVLFVVLLATSKASSPTGSGPQVASLVATGQVRITTAHDGLSALVSVDAARPDGTDGIVDYAFLVQTADPMRVTFAGPGTVSFSTTRLAVAPATGRGWVFPVAGMDGEPALAQKRAATIPVVGLSQYWGKMVEVTHDELVADLLTLVCQAGALGESGPGCSSCETGGPGEVMCDATCPDRSCSASCGEGFHACCSCASGCRCCAGGAPRPADSVAATGRR
jgi:hypothetical protein